MSNIIAQRIYDFLKEYPPFLQMEHEQLTTVSNAITVVYKQENAIVFNQGDEAQKWFYIVKEGAIGLYKNFYDDRMLLDICDEGDIFGLRPLMEADAYRMSAIASEESIIYAIPVEVLLELMESNTDVKRYLHASFNVNIQDGSGNKDMVQVSDQYFDQQTVSFSKTPVCCDASTSVREAASEMNRKKVGSIVIVDDTKPIGIVTDKDLRVHVATGKISVDEAVEAIMSSPVITAPANISVSESQILMMRNKITHICITEDGTDETKLLGILSQRDIVALRGNNPAVILKEIQRTTDLSQLIEIRKKVNSLTQDYISQLIPMQFITGVISEITNEMMRWVIKATLEESGKPPARFCWMSLGSQGRGEQLLLTDQDNALIFDNRDEGLLDDERSWFVAFSEKVNDKLHALGYEYCPAEMMARNPKWCLSVSEWKGQYRNWITNPSEESVMLCTIFFDFTPLYGDIELIELIEEEILDAIDSYDVFINYLARNAVLNPPPIGFFRQFLVEADGEHKDQFDLKARALMPLVDAARVLALSEGIIHSKSTLGRYSELIKLEPQNESIYTSCIEAYKTLLWFRTSQGFRNNDSGRYIPIKELSKSERLELKESFKPVKDIQEVVRNRFRLAQIM